jgi:hypothetical protein
VTPYLRLVIWLFGPRDPAELDRMWCWLFHDDDEHEETCAS